MFRSSRSAAALFAVFLATGCSMQRFAAKQLGNALADGGKTFAGDDDPELVGAALPFSLKLMESVLEAAPEHRPLLVALSRGFAQYTYGWVEPAANGDGEASIAARERAKHLYLRARDYGMRALCLSIDDFRAQLTSNPRRAISLAQKRDVPALYWTAASWGLAVASAKDDLDLLADLPVIEAMISRAAELDPGFDDGAIDMFLITWDASRAGISKDAAASAREHLQQAITRTGGKSASPFVAAAEALSIPEQNEREFDELLARALAVDPAARPEWRLQNILAQRRARWLLANRDDFFVETSSGGRQ